MIGADRRYARGMTLIELLISIVIGLLLAAAASYLFVSTHRISAIVDAKSQQQETASVVLDIIGRDLKNAGFYPANFPATTASAKFQGVYANVVGSTVVAYDQGVFGCSGGAFNVTTGTCPTPDATKPDSLVVNYFSADNFAVRGVGTRQDCLGQNVEQAAFGGTAYNQARAGAGATGTGTVDLPLFISNAYGLGDSYTFQQGNQSISTRSFRCAGNGPNDNPYQPLLAGIEQLRFRYGVASATSMEAPERFYTATEVSAMAPVEVEGQLKTAWQRVTAVQVCVLAKTLDPSVRQTTSGKYVDCDGNEVSFSASDRAIYQQRTRILALRNNHTQTF